MSHEHKRRRKIKRWHFLLMGLTVFIGGFALVFIVSTAGEAVERYSAGNAATTTAIAKPQNTLDFAAYDEKMLQLANYNQTVISSTTPKRLWPVKTVYPNMGALLPFNRIVAYYGNFYSTGMGVLGEYPEDEMIAKLEGEVAKWQAADPTTPVIPAIDYIVVTAQGSPGKDGMYRLRMPDDQIDKALAIANKVHGIVVLDVQVGKSTVQQEVPLLEKYLSMPNVHLAIDPEFSMKTGAKPGTVIGTMSASDVNFTANYLAQLVRKNNLPPKILVVHRFTEEMVTNYKQITPLPEVQIVMDMDGWGSPGKKYGTYNAFIYGEPVQFTGFKLFYKNDLLPPSTRMLTPDDLMKIIPRPSFIQYQ